MISEICISASISSSLLNGGSIQVLCPEETMITNEMTTLCPKSPLLFLFPMAGCEVATKSYESLGKSNSKK